MMPNSSPALPASSTNSSSNFSSNSSSNPDAGMSTLKPLGAYLPLVEAIVMNNLKKYNLVIDSHSGDFKDDLVHLGFIGLHCAVRKYDPSRGKFSSYAWPWIEKYVRKELSDMVRRRMKTASLNAPVRQDEEDGESLLDTLPDTGATPVADIVGRRELRERLRAALRKLPARERFVVDCHFGLRDNTPRPFREIGEELGVTPQRVHVILQKSLKTLHRELRHVA